MHPTVILNDSVINPTQNSEIVLQTNEVISLSCALNMPFPIINNFFQFQKPQMFHLPSVTLQCSENGKLVAIGRANQTQKLRRNDIGFQFWCLSPPDTNIYETKTHSTNNNLPCEDNNRYLTTAFKIINFNSLMPRTFSIKVVEICYDDKVNRPILAFGKVKPVPSKYFQETHW